MFSKSHKRGFTLIELLVVVSIIGMLSSVVLASLTTARARGRDSTRIQSLVQLRNALELYRTTFGSFPLSSSPYNSDCASLGAAGFKARTGASGWIPNLAPNYIATLPLDSSQNSGTGQGCYVYISSASGDNYKIIFKESSEALTCSGAGASRFCDIYPGPGPRYSLSISSNSSITPADFSFDPGATSSVTPSP